MKITGAIFDMDGTLLDSMYVWGGVIVKYAFSHGISPREEFYSDIRDMKIAQIPAYLQKEYGHSCTREKFINALYSIVEESYRTEVRPKPGIIELLEQFHGRGIKMCVATATEQYVAKMVLERLDMLRFFSDIITCSMVGAGKDKPVIYEAALKSLGTPKAETPVFEDALYAMRTAKAAGFPVIGVYDEFFETDWETVKSLADAVIFDFRDSTAL